jgi:hypothetical protein
VLQSGSLDELLGGEEFHATFHDASVRRISVDYQARRWEVHLDVCVGDPDAEDEGVRERRRPGTLIVEGLAAWVMESGVVSGEPLWLTADGPLAQSPTDAGRALAKQHAGGAVGWYLFFSDLNSFAYVIGAQTTFEWG